MAENENPSSSLTGLKAEAELHKLVIDESIDDIILKYLLPNGAPHSWESSLWDYKREAPNTSGRKKEQNVTSVEIAELVKDAVSFHNSHGGYIIFGIDEKRKDSVVGCDNLNPSGFTLDKFNQQLASYIKGKINCKFKNFDINTTGGKKAVGVLLIPMRRAKSPVVRMMNGAPEIIGKSPVFRKGDIYARIADACVKVQDDIQELQFVCSSRQYDGAYSGDNRADENLPAPDPNLVQFVGRADYLLALWHWITVQSAPIKVLTALGGTGKTAIAYEFCKQIVSNVPASLSKVIWLTAKRETFSPMLGRWISTTRTDFNNANEFFAKLAGELGATDNELERGQEREDYLELILRGLKEFPSLVVLDDIDSLELEHQSDLFSSLQVLSGRAFDTGSRFLVTSRLELSAGYDQRIAIGGFNETEFHEYAKMIASQHNLSISPQIIQRMHKVSLGSPVFCSSILRLVSLGYDINNAINSWKDKAGEDVREFAFERELSQLTDSQKRALFALICFGETTQLELKQVLNVSDSTIIDDLARLREYHLFSSKGDPGTGLKLEVPEPIRLMKKVVREKLLDPVRIENECLRLRAHSPKVEDKIGASINNIMALTRSGDIDSALFVAQRAAKDHSKSGDIMCLLGCCYLKFGHGKAADADKSFKAANDLHSKRPELLNSWFESKKLQSDWNGILEIEKISNKRELMGPAIIYLLDARLALADQLSARGDYARALPMLKGAMLLAQNSISQKRALRSIDVVRERCRLASKSYVELTHKVSTRPGDKLNVFNAVMDAFRCHITESWMIHLALDSIMIWAKDISSRSQRDSAATNILAARLEDIDEIKQHLKASSKDRVTLATRVEDVKNKLDTQYKLLTQPDSKSA